MSPGDGPVPSSDAGAEISDGVEHTDGVDYTDGAEITAAVERAAEEIRSAWNRVDLPPPAVALILGSGLGELAEEFRERVVLDYRDVPGWPETGVSGHAGRLIYGLLAGVPAVAMQGRVHLYEGHPASRCAFPMRVLGALGIRWLLVSNAAGAVNRSFRPGELMLIRDHVDLTWRSPLLGSAPEAEPRWPDMHDCYDPELADIVRWAAGEEGMQLREGVYAAMLGPSYETPAEIRMLHRLGADAVGMSTVPEVIAARAVGIRCAGVSCLTNYAAGLSRDPLSHEDVLETAERAAADFRRLMIGTVARLASGPGKRPRG